MSVPHQINRTREMKNYFQNFSFVEHNSQMATTRSRGEIFNVPHKMKWSL